MTMHNIKCVDKCGEVLAKVELDTIKVAKVDIDKHYGFLCDGCSVKRRQVKEAWQKKHSEIVAKVAKAASITPAEMESLLRATR